MKSIANAANVTAIPSSSARVAFCCHNVFQCKSIIAMAATITGATNATILVIK
jgi:hypothetical protein